MSTCPGWELLQDREVLFPIRRYSALKVPGHTRPYSGYLPTQGVSLLSPNWMSFPEIYQAPQMPSPQVDTWVISLCDWEFCGRLGYPCWHGLPDSLVSTLCTVSPDDNYSITPFLILKYLQIYKRSIKNLKPKPKTWGKSNILHSIKMPLSQIWMSEPPVTWFKRKGKKNKQA